MNTESNIKANIRQFIINNFLLGDESKMVSDNVSFMESSIINSTGILEVIMFLEENYNIKVEENELIPENLDSVDNAAAFIIKKSSTN
jgi:acyl carrier protein